MWSHLDRVLSGVNGGISAMKAAAGRGAEERHLVTLFESLVLSRIEYSLPIIQLSLNQLNRIEIVQNS